MCVFIWGFIVKVNGINSVNVLQKNGLSVCSAYKKDIHSCPSINSISNICYKPVSFGRTWAEHKSWGAVIDPDTKDVSFKLLTYPDTKKVEVTVQKRNNENSVKTYDLMNCGNGVFVTDKKIPASEVSHGDKYFYTLYKGNGEVARVKDPYSFRQESLLGASTVYDHSLFEWNDGDWYRNNKNRISRLANKQNQLTSVDAARIYEFNTASLTKKGTFEGAKAIIKSLPQLGFNAIEIMPVENTYSFNWGYDGVDKMAPAEHLGGPDSLKSFIDFAHEQGLNVIMDMVPNHLGPDGATLLKTGPFIKGKNAFGEAFNFEGQNSRYVRDYIVNAAINWIDNYHCDGLRLDMTKFMESDSTMKQIAAEINYHKPDAFLIAEDARNGISVDDNGNFWNNYDEPHDKRVVNPLKPFESGIGENEEFHCDAIENIENGNTTLGRLGYDSEWDFNYFHTLKDHLYGNCNLDALYDACLQGQTRLKYVMSHDEIGNIDGTRLISKVVVNELNLCNKMADCSENEKCKLMAHASHQILVSFVIGQLENMSDEERINFYNKNKIAVDIPVEKVQDAYFKAIQMHMLAIGKVYSIPGPKMIFQGDESANLSYFKFFRKFSIGPETYLKEKGYEPGLPAFLDSKLSAVKVSDKYSYINKCVEEYVRDLNLLCEHNIALSSGHIEKTFVFEQSDTHAVHCKKIYNEVFSISNFKSTAYYKNYGIMFPKGKWKEIFNSDRLEYFGENKYLNEDSIKEHFSYISLPSYGIVFFEKICRFFRAKRLCLYCQRIFKLKLHRCKRC